jgi:hypothetical protein
MLASLTTSCLLVRGRDSKPRRGVEIPSAFSDSEHVQAGSGGLWRDCIFHVTGSPSMVENPLQVPLEVSLSLYLHR